MSRKSTWRSGGDATRKSTAFEPDLDFDMIDYRQPSGEYSEFTLQNPCDPYHSRFLSVFVRFRFRQQRVRAR